MIDALHMTKEDFDNIPAKEWSSNSWELPTFYSMVIIPTERIHDSGFRCMDFVLLDKSWCPICKVSFGSDVVQADRINPNNTKLFRNWNIDCLPCGYVRFFNPDGAMVYSGGISDFMVQGVENE